MNVVNGGWRKAKSPPYKHTIVAYGASMAVIPSQTSNSSCPKIRHNILPWRRHDYHLTTLRTIGTTTF
ncbi:hypothetical protein MTR_3g105775 [Medicago truncatula]|uniref:Uncharacterized protein n=1 Tax=Medicago truncatula TaxID=3880 RepID=A0A072VCN5_MEDTR|nr:hypothetical protein MTR_3g105775 [Medicago truncatula]